MVDIYEFLVCFGHYSIKIVYKITTLQAKFIKSQVI